MDWRAFGRELLVRLFLAAALLAIAGLAGAARAEPLQLPPGAGFVLELDTTNGGGPLVSVDVTSCDVRVVDRSAP